MQNEIQRNLEYRVLSRNMSNWTLMYFWWSINHTAFEESVWQFHRNIDLPHDPIILLLHIYPKEMKTYVHINTCVWMFIVALFIIAQN
jgi:hypothetical protein